MSSNSNDSIESKTIRSCYRDILEREPDELGLDFYLQKIMNKEISLEQIRSMLMQSDEYVNLKNEKEQLKKISSNLIDRKPIFIFGVARSGTALLYAILCAHPDVVWFTKKELKNWIPEDEQQKIKEHYLDLLTKGGKIPRGEASLIVDELQTRKKRRSTFLRLPEGLDPIEGESFWNKFFTNEYVTDIPKNKKITLLNELNNFLENKKKQRFVNKAPQHCKRLFALQKCFPDAKFINIYRDPRAVISSMMERHKIEGSFDSAIPIKDVATYEKLGLVEKFAWQYKEITETILEFSKQNHTNFFSVQYEKLLSKPTDHIKKILEFCELEIVKNLDSLIPPLEYKSRTKWYDNITKYDQHEIHDILLPTLKKAKYPYKFDLLS